MTIISEWRFTSTIERPDGMRVEVDITVPEGVATKDVLDQSEIAQMAADAVFRVRSRPATTTEEKASS